MSSSMINLSNFKTYNKLVRDKIPEIILSKGKSLQYRVLNKTEYLMELDKKLNEECNEYQISKSIDELADILEVVYCIAVARGYSLDELMTTRIKKSDERGSFKDRIYLEKVYD